MPAGTTVPDLRKEGIRSAGGEIVALAEDHCVFDGNWCAELKKAHESDYQVIGGVDPEGICGSGMVDILAEMLRTEWMTPQGRFADGLDEYTVAPGRGITFSRSDASELAQTKASNACGQPGSMRLPGAGPAAATTAEKATTAITMAFQFTFISLILLPFPADGPLQILRLGPYEHGLDCPRNC